VDILAKQDRQWIAHPVEGETTAGRVYP